MPPEQFLILASHLLSQNNQEELLKVNLKGNLTLEGVHRDQSGTYGCRVEDYDAAEDAQLVKTLKLRVACESFGREGGQGVVRLHQLLSLRVPTLAPSRVLVPEHTFVSLPCLEPAVPPQCFIEKDQSPFNHLCSPELSGFVIN